MPGLIRREAFSSAQAFSFGDLEHHARALLAQAEAQTEALLAAARVRAEQEAERIKSDAHTTGLAEGRRAGMEAVRRETQQTALKEARKRLDDLSGTLLAALQQYDQQRHALQAQAESGLLRLAIEIARRVCKYEVGRLSDAVVANARALLDLVRDGDNLVLHVHPEDLEACRTALTDWIEQSSGASGTPCAEARPEPRPPGANSAGAELSRTQLAHVHVAADPSVARGTCRLTTREGRIDASVDTQLDRIARALLGDALEAGETA